MAFYAQHSREACLARGLLENDDHLRLAMQEARIFQSPANMRCLFAIILTECSPSNSAELWETFKETLSEDYLTPSLPLQGGWRPGVNRKFTL